MFQIAIITENRPIQVKAEHKSNDCFLYEMQQ